MAGIRMRSLRFFVTAACLLTVPHVLPSAPVPKEGSTPFVLWRFTSEPVTNEMHDPVVVKNVVIVGNDRGELMAFRPTDGKLLWNHHHGKRLFYRPSGDDERVYFTSEEGVAAVTSDTGTPVWNFPITHGGGPSFVVPEKGLVFVGGGDGNLYALNAKTGEERWKADFVTDAPPDRPRFPGANARIGNSRARPTAISSDGEKLFLSVFDQSRVVAFDVTTGKRIWSFQAGGWISAQATATPTNVFIGSQDTCLHCLDKQTGRSVWTFETKNRVSSGAAVDATFVYFGSCDGGFYCIGQSDGKLRWRFETDLWRNGRRSPIYSDPILRRGSLYFAAGEGQLYAVEQATGKLKWKLRPSENSDLFCSPATDGTRYFVVTRPGIDKQGASTLVAVALK